MADITITGKKKLKTISDEFQKNFPYLMLVFLSDAEQKKADDKGGKVKVLSHELTLASARTITPAKTTDISVHGRTKVSTLEKNFRDEYGLNLQVGYANDKGAYYTSGALDEMTLTQLNKQMQENGCKLKPKLKQN